MDESARLKTGQSGSWIQSTTWPWKAPGARKIRSSRLPVAPPRSRPSVMAQLKRSSPQLNRRTHPDLRVPALWRV